MKRQKKEILKKETENKRVRNKSSMERTKDKQPYLPIKH